MATLDGRELSDREVYERARDACLPCVNCGGLISLQGSGHDDDSREFFRLYRRLRDAGRLRFVGIEALTECAGLPGSRIIDWKEPRE